MNLESIVTPENVTLSSVSVENIPHLWKQSSILIFLINLDNYEALSPGHLNSVEREYLERLYLKLTLLKTYLHIKTILGKSVYLTMKSCISACHTLKIL